MVNNNFIILNKKIRPEAFVKYIEAMNCPRLIRKIVMHHTSSPAEKWQGSASMLHYYNIYKSRGYMSGPHIFVAPDGIWLFTPIEEEGTHAGLHGNPFSIGIEVVGDYTNEAPTDPEIKKYLAIVMATLGRKFNLDENAIVSHKQIEPDSYCSAHLTKEWNIQNIKNHEQYENQVYENIKNTTESHKDS